MLLGSCDDNGWTSWADGRAMTDKTSDPAKSGSGSRRAIRFFGRLLLVGPPILLLLGTATGIGVLRGVPAGLAVLAGMALTLLPILGLSRLARRAPYIPVWATWLWCAIALANLPLYFPGERAEAAQAGLGRFGAFLGPAGADWMSSAGPAVLRLLAEDPKPAVPRAHPQEPTNPESALGVRVLPLEEPVAARPEARQEESVRLSYRGDERSLRIEVEIDGPEIGERFSIVFDTGATFTTLDRASLEAIGIAVPPEAPRVTLQTANGTIEASLVLVDAVWLGESAVEWVTVAVCESCSNPPAVGLLGLNVAQRFHVALDHDRQTIDLRRNEYGDNRALDIRNWLQIRSEATESWDGSVSVKLTGFNASRQAIKSAVIDLDCSGAGFAIELGEIPPRGESSAEAELPRGTNCREQTLDLARAYWKLDRFD